MEEKEIKMKKRAREGGERKGTRKERERDERE